MTPAAIAAPNNDTTAIDGVSAAAYRHSTNGVPNVTGASFRVSISYGGGKAIGVDCAGWFWFGGKLYERLHSALWQAAGARLMKEALQRLACGDRVMFHNGGTIEKRTEITLTRDGVCIRQKGMIRRKDFMIEWRHLKMENANGTCYLKSYATGEKADFQLWHMPNNVVFRAVLNFLMDKANYRMLEATA
jgi:hypothetical protein